MSTDPTQPAPTPYNYYDINPYTGIPSAPPPPPKQRRTRGWVVAIVVIALLFIVGSTLYYLMYRSMAQTGVQTRMSVVPILTHAATSIPTVALSPSPDVNYTAIDIVGRMRKADKLVSAYDQNETIWQFSHDNYFISIQSSSSTQFTGCPFESSQQCADAWYFGIWVYSSGNGAISAWQQVESDSLSCYDTSPASDGMHVSCGQQEPAYVHGRCLLLNSGGQSTYGQIVTQYCV